MGRVLIVDDNEDNLLLFQEYLEDNGFETALATSGAEALTFLEENTVDVIVLDIQMPEMDGLQATRWIVQRRGPEGLPRVVAMTANAMPGDREAYIAAGMDGYVAKPINMEELAAAMAGVAALALSAGVPKGPQTVLDTARLDHLHSIQEDSQPGLVQEVIDLFVADAPAHLQGLRDALVAQDAGRLARLAHRLLSATQNIGAHNMSSLCLEIERLGREGDLAALAQLVPQLSDELDKACHALRTERLRY